MDCCTILVITNSAIAEKFTVIAPCRIPTHCFNKTLKHGTNLSWQWLQYKKWVTHNLYRKYRS